MTKYTVWIRNESGVRSVWAPGISHFEAKKIVECDSQLYPYYTFSIEPS